MSKYPILYSSYTELNKFNDINYQKVRTKHKKVPVYDKSSELYNEYLEIYFYETRSFQILKKKSWLTYMILKNYF